MYQVPIIIRLFISFYEVIMSSFNTICYLSVLLLQLQNPNLLTIILTLMVFIWGALSVPRPTKRFWKVILVYTGVIIYRVHIFANNVVGIYLRELSISQMLLIVECVCRISFFKLDLPDLQYEYLHGPLHDYDSRRDFSFYYLLVMLSIFLQRCSARVHAIPRYF